ncbi:hypothetical protein BT_3901 [Bacteroides thetaiotaomicron VPI-5482]|uniref:Uncharacterized protein n=1 Tax=Bacteroides thetaiotaomicron (strain ATCC 29148 / DSM 2079 / JCM 5827 / CCUG 10774 / NCTC 10582 / VPI-5482 / E50) TaxID=226186 RepID=Q8A0X0_BACTN|nr:hypothetical protein BT_3901 [Bacteroides thetaiotaomicron VPI-5482]
MGRGLYEWYYKENIIQLEFVTYSDREVDVLRRATGIIHFSQTKFSGQVDKESVDFVSNTHSKSEVKSFTSAVVTKEIFLNAIHLVFTGNTACQIRTGFYNYILSVYHSKSCSSHYRQFQVHRISLDITQFCTFLSKHQRRLNRPHISKLIFHSHSNIKTYSHVRISVSCEITHVHTYLSIPGNLRIRNDRNKCKQHKNQTFFHISHFFSLPPSSLRAA